MRERENELKKKKPRLQPGPRGYIVTDRRKDKPRRASKSNPSPHAAKLRKLALPERNVLEHGQTFAVIYLASGRIVKRIFVDRLKP